jgi:uncharacterized protein YeeX (DUF496 family)
MYSTFLGMPIAYWLELKFRIDSMDKDKAFALEDLIVKNVKLERELREIKSDLRGVGNMVKRYTGETK